MKKIIELTSHAATLPETVNELKSVLGDELFNHLSKERRHSPHPFAESWKELSDGALKSKISGFIQLSKSASFLGDALFHLSLLTEDPLFGELLKKLKPSDQYFSTAFEAFIGAEYIERDQRVSIVPEAPEARKQRPDLQVEDVSGAVVFLECKSLQDDVRTEQRAWNTLYFQMSKLLSRTSTNSPEDSANLGVCIRAKRTLRPADVPALIKTARGLIGAFSGPTTLTGPDFDMAIAQLSDGTMTILVPADGATSQTEISVPMRAFGEHRYGSANQSERLARNLRNAADQLPQEHPGVVHLQVPYKESRHFQEVVDAARPELEGILSRRPHVCAVVITGRFLNTRAQDGDDPIETFHTVLPNYKASHQLPSSFELVGSCPIEPQIRRATRSQLKGFPDNKFCETPRGTMILDFGINKPLPDQYGRYLAQYCSPDGMRQLNVWQSYKKLLRIEIMHEVFGRIAAEGDLNHLETGVTHRILVTWSETGVKCGVNGKMVMLTRL